VIINATSAGLQMRRSELPSGVIRKGALAYDMVYGATRRFSAAARAAGARTSDGLGCGRAGAGRSSSGAG